MKVASTPAINKDGFSKVTFVSWSEEIRKTKETKEPVSNPETGEVESYITLNFSIMDTTRQNPIKRKLFLSSIGTAYSDTLLSGLGFTRVVEYEADDDGFLVEKVEVDDDGFTSSNDANLVSQVVEFLDGIVGKHYLAKVERDNKGYWEIVPETLKPIK